MKVACFFIIFCLINSCSTSESKKVSLDPIEFKIPTGWPKPNYLFKGNGLTAKRMALGKKLFFDKRLSSDSTISCESCHHQNKAFSDAESKFSIGVNGKKSIRNSPGLFNLAWSKTFMWDGGVNHIEFQPIAPITNPLEMNESLERVIRNISSNSEYKILFKEAYQTDSITSELVLKAFAQFLGTLVSCKSKYDSIMNREKGYTFSSDEAAGYEIFKTNCASCHTEPLFTNQSFENNGLKLSKENPDVGRYVITKSASDSMKFKVPSLRNLKFTAPYMHDGRFSSLRQVIDHYVNGVTNYSNLNQQIKKIKKFTVDEKRQLISFLNTLNDFDFCIKSSK